MTSIKQFSEISQAYNKNIASINEAKSIFQSEISVLGGLILEKLLEIRVIRHTADGKNEKIEWSNADDYSTTKEGNWLNFSTGGKIGLSIKPPKNKVFKRETCSVYFEIVFDKDMATFVFRARLENSNSANKNIDEKIIEIIQADYKDKFLNFSGIKSNTAILFRLPLEDSLFETYGNYISESIEVCERAVNELFPDSSYEVKVADVKEVVEVKEAVELKETVETREVIEDKDTASPVIPE